MGKRILILLASVTAVIVLSSCAASLPKKESIAKLTNEQAANVLKGKKETEIKANWGEPDGMLSGFYGDIYVYNGKQIVIYYDADCKVTNIMISDQQK